MINYRKAAIGDVNGLVIIRCEFLAEANVGLSETDLNEIGTECINYFNTAISDGSFVAWLAEIDGEIIATSGICFYNVPPNKSCPNGKVAYIQNMYTKEKYRRQGIAKKLFEKMMEEARACGCRKILLNATQMGKPMYEKFGFKDIHGDMVCYI